jgi:hypothetical protein
MLGEHGVSPFLLRALTGTGVSGSPKAAEPSDEPSWHGAAKREPYGFYHGDLRIIGRAGHCIPCIVPMRPPPPPPPPPPP